MSRGKVFAFVLTEARGRRHLLVDVPSYNEVEVAFPDAVEAKLPERRLQNLSESFSSVQLSSVACLDKNFFASFAIRQTRCFKDTLLSQPLPIHCINTETVEHQGPISKCFEN